jgi:hypothetical protein
LKQIKGADIESKSLFKSFINLAIQKYGTTGFRVKKDFNPNSNCIKILTRCFLRQQESSGDCPLEPQSW